MSGQGGDATVEALRCCDQQDSIGSDLESIAKRWEMPDPTGTMPNVRQQERRKCAAELRAYAAETYPKETR